MAVYEQEIAPLSYHISSLDMTPSVWTAVMFSYDYTYNKH